MATGVYRSASLLNAAKWGPAAKGSGDELPRWPFAAMFVLYPLWWVLGPGSMAWIPLAGVMMLYMLRRGRIQIPRSFALWMIFLLLMFVSVIGIDSPSRLIGFFYRASQYVAVGIAFVYVYNARAALTLRYVLGALTVFWLWVVIGGYASMAFPLFSFSTPMAYILPQGLVSNELVGEMAFRRLTQYNPNSWLNLDPRPSAPFLYTNAWGNVYSMLLPVAICYLKFARGTKLFVPLLIVLPLSLVPAYLTLNRGMFIGIGVALVFVAVMAFLGGHMKVMGVLVVLAVILGGTAVVLDVGDRLETRVETSSSTQDRANLYDETLERTLESPIFGYGAPRPSITEGAPSAGTQGQIWTIMFSHGLPALFFFLAWLAWSFVVTLQLRDPVRFGLSSVLLVVLVESAYYGVAANGLVLSMAVAGVLMRPSGPAKEPEPTVSTPSDRGMLDSPS